MPQTVRLLRALGVALLVVSHLSHAQDTTKTFFTRRDLYWTGVGVAGGAVISIFDVRIADWWRSSSVQGSSSRKSNVKSFTVINETPLTIGAVVTYGVGRLVRNPTIADIGLHTTEALVLTVALSEAIRAPLGRARPELTPDDQYDFQFWGGFTNFGRRSYPSLHAAAGFAAASALVQEIHFRAPSVNTWAAPILYSAALIPGFTRLYLDEHWASDVFSGSILGAVLGTKVVNYTHTHKRNRVDRWLLGATIVPTANGLMVSRSF